MYLRLALAISMLGCSHPTEERDILLKPPVAVEVAKVDLEQIPLSMTLVGTTEPYTQGTPATRLMGKITQADFEEGDRVERGQILVRIENEDLEARRKQAESGLLEARAVLANAEANARRIRNLYQASAVPKQRLDEVETASLRAKAGVTAAEETVLEVEANLRYSAIESPVSGVIVRKFAQALVCTYDPSPAARAAGRHAWPAGGITFRWQAHEQAGRAGETSDAARRRIAGAGA